MLKDIVIVGSSGLAKEIAFLIEDINKTNAEWNFLGFVDENVGQNVWKSEIFMNDTTLLGFKKEINVIIGVGFPDLIKKLALKFESNNNIKFPNLIHPNAVGDWENIEMNKGNVITAGNIFTTDIKIGSFNIFNLNGTVGHDTKIGNYNVFNPTYNISGGVTINEQTLLGTGVQILQNLSVVSDTIIGAGALLTKSIEEHGVYVGSPAKKIK